LSQLQLEGNQVGETIIRLSDAQRLAAAIR
jgi:hypothetical protein